MREGFTGLAVSIKMITPPEDVCKDGKLKALNYMLQNVDEHNFLLFREVPTTEVEWFKEEKLIAYEDVTYVMLANLPSEEHAMVAIESYWRAIKEINSITD
ncbi:hypothetical protein COE50_06060 [Bacillus anthracis]|nr:hypothetical protein COE50_06060 [Bacillus anthracis]